MPIFLPTSSIRPAFEQGCVTSRLYVCNVLNYRILGGGGIAGLVTHSFFVEYRAFQRCLRALLGGFIVYIRPHNCGSYLLYQET